MPLPNIPVGPKPSPTPKLPDFSLPKTQPSLSENNVLPDALNLPVNKKTLPDLGSVSTPKPSTLPLFVPSAPDSTEESLPPPKNSLKQTALPNTGPETEKHFPAPKKYSVAEDTDPVKKDSKNKPLFVDEEKLELVPLGERGKSRKAKVGEFDKRRDMRKTTIAIKTVIVSLLLIMVGLGIKNAIIPPKVLTVGEVGEIIDTQTGVTKFPLDRGRGFAQSFMAAFLEVDSTPTAQQALTFFYTGAFSDIGTAGAARTTTSLFKQKIVDGPIVFSSKSNTDYSAQYTIGALIAKGNKESISPTAIDGKRANAFWRFFNVNVYYDEKADSFLITPDSPSIVPAMEVGQTTNLPNELDLGNGDRPAQIQQEMRSTIEGFIKGFTVSTPTNHSELDQYVIANPPVELLKGLNRELELNGNVSDAINFSVYSTNDPNIYKVDLRVQWKDVSGVDKESNSETKIVYNSRYVATIEKTIDGKFLVSSFKPRIFLKNS